jgi:hypothetical protein
VRVDVVEPRVLPAVLSFERPHPRLDMLVPVRGSEPSGRLDVIGSASSFLGLGLASVTVSRLGRADTVRSVTAESELAGFIAKFAPEMQCRIRGCRARLEARFPDAVQMVYDNYNFLVIGFGPTRRASDAILSLAAHARGVNLCFLQRGPELPDPTSILRGSGKVVRTVALDSPDDLDRPDVGALIEVALRLATTPMDASDNGDLIIKSVSAKQRPRR